MGVGLRIWKRLSHAKDRNSLNVAKFYEPHFQLILYNKVFMQFVVYTKYSIKSSSHILLIVMLTHPQLLVYCDELTHIKPWGIVLLSFLYCTQKFLNFRFHIFFKNLWISFSLIEKFMACLIFNKELIYFFVSILYTSFILFQLLTLLL